MPFDTTGAPLFWHNDVNERAITWTPPWIQRQDTNNELQNQTVHILPEPQRIPKSILPSTKEGATSVPGALRPTNLNLRNAIAHVGASQEAEVIFKARGIRFLNQIYTINKKELIDAKLTEPQADQLIDMVWDIIESQMKNATPQTMQIFSRLCRQDQRRSYYLEKHPKAQTFRRWKRSNAWHSLHSNNIRNYNGQWNTNQSSESGWRASQGGAEYSPWYKEMHHERYIYIYMA